MLFVFLNDVLESTRSKKQPSRDDLKEKLEIKSSGDGDALQPMQYYAYHASCNLKKEGYDPKPSHLQHILSVVRGMHRRFSALGKKAIR